MQRSSWTRASPWGRKLELEFCICQSNMKLLHLLSLLTFTFTALAYQGLDVRASSPHNFDFTSVSTTDIFLTISSPTALNSNATTSHATKPSAATISVFEAAAGAAAVRRGVNAKNQRKDKSLDTIRHRHRHCRIMGVRGRELGGMRRRLEEETW